MTTDATDEVQMDELLRKRRELELLRRKKEMKEKNGLAFYRPHPKQDKFHRAGCFRRRYCRWGNRTGKSTCGTAEILAWAIGERIWYEEDDPARQEGLPNHPVKCVILVADWDKAEEIFTSQEEGERRGKLFKLCPQNAIVDVQKGPAGSICKLVVKHRKGGHSSIYIDTVKSYLMNPMGHESGDWDAVYVDEPCPQAMWIAYARGLVDRRGSAWFMCTPITEMWINDYFIPRAQTRSDFESPLMNDKKSTWVITGSTFDNPYMSRESIEDFIRDLPERDRATRIEGRPQALAGVIHRDFERDVHVYYDVPHGWKAIDKPPSDWTIRFAIDPHPQKPHAVLFIATGPHEVSYVYDEIFVHCLISELCELIHCKEGWDRAEDVLCDPIAFIEDPRDGSTMASDMMLYDIIPDLGSKDLSRGILLVDEKLRQRDNNGQPTLLFNHTLGETLFEFDRYVWDAKKPKPLETAPDHMMENLRRLITNGLDYVKPTAREYKVIQPIEVRRALLDLPIGNIHRRAHNRRYNFSLAKRYPI